jgi:hypothetical protein
MDGKQCIVEICEGISTSRWKKITETVLNKAEANGTLASYYKSHKDEYMCMSCYNSIVVNKSSKFKEHAVEWERRLKRRRNDDSLSMSGSIALLTNIIHERDVAGNHPPIVAFSQLRSIAEAKDRRLSSFFDDIEEAASVGGKNVNELKETNRSLAYQCYLMYWNRRMESE